MELPLYPLRFTPILRTALWGGQRLADWLRQPRPIGPEPVAEAWLLSDQGEHLSRVREGPLAGWTLRYLLEHAGPRLLGRPLPAHGRFPLLLKFLDAREPLSVQVHPDDRRAAHSAGPAHTARGKTEAWVILDATPDSILYAGLRPGVRAEYVRGAIDRQTLADLLHRLTPRPGDCLFLPAGTVHALGAGVLLFEVQQTSDITYRLYDWGRLDARTGQPRELHVEQGLACIDFERGPVEFVRPTVDADGPAQRERLIACDYFRLWRWRSAVPFTAGATGECRVLVGLEGDAIVEYRGGDYALGPGDVLLLPAEVGACPCRPGQRGQAVTVLECGLPE